MGIEEWITVIDEGIPLALLAVLGLVLYRGSKKNQALFGEREELFKRYLLYRGDKQVHLRVHAADETVRKELVRNLSASWKRFKKANDQSLASILRNTGRTRWALWIVTLGLLANSARLLVGEVVFFGVRIHLLSVAIRELSIYVPVVLGFLLLRMQTRRFLPVNGEMARLEREILFFPNAREEKGYEGLYDEFDPLEETGAPDE